jgi:2-amino-4-hydroxy-6-hydroxymethyldihydropteridine diphosphokinase
LTAPASHEAYVALGANLDDPLAQVRAGFEALDRLESTAVVRRSSLYRTAPVGYAEQPDFVNAVALLATELDAAALLRALLAIEERRGRVRDLPNGPRTLDLDLLLYDQASISQEDLVVPHPRMHERAFVLVPLLEIAPDIAIPGRGPAARCLAALDARGVEQIADA